MKRHLTASAVSISTGNDDGAGPAVANRSLTALKNTRTQPVPDERSLGLASVSAWTHTLLLTGELTQRSAHRLEMEIDRLCEEGVTGITLDLRELSYIDATGVAVIAFRCGLCERRGYDVALLPGPRFIQRAFEQAGLAELLPFRGEDRDALAEDDREELCEGELGDDLRAPRLRALAFSHSTQDAAAGGDL